MHRKTSATSWTALFRDLQIGKVTRSHRNSPAVYTTPHLDCRCLFHLSMPPRRQTLSLSLSPLREGGSMCIYFDFPRFPGRNAKYCDKYVRLRVRLPLHISETTRPGFTNFRIHVACSKRRSRCCKIYKLPVLRMTSSYRTMVPMVRRVHS